MSTNIPRGITKSPKYIGGPNGLASECRDALEAKWPEHVIASYGNYEAVMLEKGNVGLSHMNASANYPSVLVK